MEELSKKEVKEKIIEILKYGSLIPSRHAIRRMAKRGYSMGDLKHILKNGEILIPTIKEEGIYLCEVYGDDLEGDSGKISVEIHKREIVIITVLS